MLSEENMPEEFFGRFFYLAENDLSQGTSEATTLRPIYAPSVAVSTPEMADMDTAVALWEQGVQTLRRARDQVAAPYRREYRRELDMAAYLQAAFRSIANANRFFALRAQYRKLTESSRLTAADRETAVQRLDDMAEVAKAELVNARRALPIVRRDPRLDLAVRLDLDFPPLAKIIEAKIKYTEKLIREEIPAERKKVSGQPARTCD